MFTKDTKSAIIQVAEACAQDMEYEFASDSMVVAETALDANRLTTFGYPDADKEVTVLIGKQGYETVLKEAAKFVPTA